jgi:hypothetical protein
VAGGETINIAKKGEIIAQKIFDEFLWEMSGSTNQKWPCTMPDNHDKRAHHPSDCVYYFDEPYKKVRTYVNVDIKSFANKSISHSEINKALTNLAQSIECANRSEDWRHLYIHENLSYEICGLLFIYNHDGEYDCNKFYKELDKIKIEKLNIPLGQRLVVFGPDAVNWLNNVRYDIRSLRGETPPRIPQRSQCRFHYPSLVRSKNIQQIRARSANIDMLSSSWIIMKYEAFEGQRQGFVVYYRGTGNTEDEFLYLIDHMMHYQMLEPGRDVLVRLYQTDERAASYFLRAKHRYLESFGESDDMKKLLENIVVEGMVDIKTTFSSVEVGME